MFILAAMLATLTTDPEIARLDVHQVESLVRSGEAIVVDVRGSVPYELGHVEGAVWMPLGLMRERAGELPQEKLIVTYCTCPKEESSLAASTTLRELGFARVAVLVGGYPAWKNAGYATASTRERQPAAASSAAPAMTRGGRLAPPAAVPCDRNDLTSYAGRITHYQRRPGKTVVVIETHAGTTETVTLRHRGIDDPSSMFLIGGQPFEQSDWERVEIRKGEVRSGMEAIAWVCRDGATLLDWRPGSSG